MNKFAMFDDDLPQHRAQVTSDQCHLFGKHMENYNVETSALHRKLQSKIDAVRILRKELEKFRVERDQYKLMAETLQLRYSALKRNSDLSGCMALNDNKSSVAKILHETRERNLKLTTEVEALKQKLHELQGDIELLRAKEAKCTRRRKSETTTNNHTNDEKEELQWKLERANFICHLESLKQKNAQLAFDFKAVIDEKEELITERDAYKCKAHRLNHELFVALSANDAHPKFLDIDGIILENKYLHECLKNNEYELETTKHTMNKYKSMLETKRKKSILKLTTSSNDESILTHKQVKSLLENGVELPTKFDTMHDLKTLSLALLDNLNDKNIALSHQKKTNKILATKISELEQRLQCIATGAVRDPKSTADDNVYAPSQLLLNGYCPSMVDINETNENISTDLKSSVEDSGTMSSDVDDFNKATCAAIVSDDGMSSLSTESGRSILSSEYGVDMCNSQAFIRNAMTMYQSSTTTTDSGNCGNNSTTSYISRSVAKERSEDLKNLPPHLAALVEKALHELDMRDFDEIVAVDTADPCALDIHAVEVAQEAHVEQHTTKIDFDMH